MLGFILKAVGIAIGVFILAFIAGTLVGIATA